MAEKKKNISLDNLEKFKKNLDKDTSKHKVLTQAEYDTLTEAEKNNGTFYFIEDGNSAVTDSDKDYIDSQDQQTLNSAKTFTTNTIQNYYAKTEVDTLLNAKADMTEATSTKSGMFSANNKVKLDGIEDGAQVNTVTGIKGSSETTYRTGEVNITSENIGLGNVENKSSETIRGEITKSNVTNALGFTPPTAEEALTSAKGYTDTKIADLINGAPATLDTLGEISQAMSDNKGVVDALDEAIGTKATVSDLTAHTGNTSNPHSVTKAQVGLGNVENKSSATIRSELTKENITAALGYTPPTTDTKYTLPTATNSVLGGVKVGSNINNSSGTISITKENVISALGYTPPTTNTTYNNATQTVAGLESANDKIKLDGIETGANKYSLPVASSTVRGGVKVGYIANDKNYPVQLSNEQMYVNVPWTDNNTTYSAFKGATASTAGGVGLVPAPTAGNQTKYLRADGTWQTPPDTNTTYSSVTTSANGLMSKDDKAKLDGIATGAQVNSITGIKGNAESSYRTGNVNITPANVGAVPISGTTMTGALVGQANANYTTAQFRNITMSNSIPSGGSNGQVHFQYN